MRQVRESEVFPNRSIDPTAGDIDRIAVFNLAYFPTERGPYNYDTTANALSAGLGPNGELNSPETRWGGIMRQLQTNDFENANVEYIQFWVMDPFNTSGGGTNVDAPNSTGGDLYFNLGNVSEDILKDGSKSFENGFTRKPFMFGNCGCPTFTSCGPPHAISCIWAHGSKFVVWASCASTFFLTSFETEITREQFICCNF